METEVVIAATEGLQEHEIVPPMGLGVAYRQHNLAPCVDHEHPHLVTRGGSVVVITDREEEDVGVAQAHDRVIAI